MIRALYWKFKVGWYRLVWRAHLCDVMWGFSLWGLLLLVGGVNVVNSVSTLILICNISFWKTGSGSFWGNSCKKHHVVLFLLWQNAVWSNLLIQFIYPHFAYLSWIFMEKWIGKYRTVVHCSDSICLHRAISSKNISDCINKNSNRAL